MSPEKVVFVKISSSAFYRTVLIYIMSLVLPTSSHPDPAVDGEKTFYHTPFPHTPQIKIIHVQDMYIIVVHI